MTRCPRTITITLSMGATALPAISRPFKFTRMPASTAANRNDPVPVWSSLIRDLLRFSFHCHSQ